MHWDRFDICEAHYCYACDYMGGLNSVEMRILARLNRMGYNPGFGGVEYRDLTENGKAIYHELVARYE